MCNFQVLIVSEYCVVEMLDHFHNAAKGSPCTGIAELLGLAQLSKHHPHTKVLHFCVISEYVVSGHYFLSKL